MEKQDFFVSRGEIEGRLDPHFYKCNQSFKNSVYIGYITYIKGGKRLPKGHHYIQSNSGYKYLRVKDIQDSDIDYSSLHNIPEKAYKILSRYELNRGELFISIAGTIGKIGYFNNIVDDKIILTENAAKIVVRDISNVKPKYLKYLLQSATIQEQIKASYIQTTIPKLGLDRIAKLKIPLPPKEIQEQIVEIMDTAYATKKANEAKAEKLLNSIDGYVLDVLGIELPPLKEEKIFIVMSDEVEGERLDVMNYSKEKDIKECKKYALKKFRKHCKYRKR